jgi:hypothetical protein
MRSFLVLGIIAPFPQSLSPGAWLVSQHESKPEGDSGKAATVEKDEHIASTG